MVKKYVVLSFASSSEALEFVELAEKLVGEGVEFIVKGNKVKAIALTSTSATQSLARVREVYRYWRMSTAPSSGVYRHPLPIVFSMAELAASIPPRCIAVALRLMGFRAEVSGSFLVTDATLQLVVRTAERVSRAYREALALNVTPSLRRIISASSAALDLPPANVLETLHRTGAVKYLADRNVWTMCLSEEKILEILKGLGEHGNKDTR